MAGILEELEQRDCDAYVVYDSSDNEDMRYLSGFLATDPFIYVYKKDGGQFLIVSSMEELRARRESPCSIVTRTAAGFYELLEKHNDADAASAEMIKNFCGEKLLVPYSMPVGFARALESSAQVTIDSGTVLSMRAKKTGVEIEKIRAVQKKNERGVTLAVDTVRKADVSEDGGLFFEDEPLTSEKLREIMHEAFFRMGLDDKDTIASCGADTALPHAKGEGQLFANQPIVLDVFPRDIETGYFADMTRTISKGKPSDEICRMYDTVHEAKELAVSLIRAGVSGADVHNAAADYFTKKGYVTAGTSGFIHSLGHGVGLAIHESPSLSVRGGVLEEGNVVTVEPGLYYPGIGGVRLEDMGAVTEDGFDRFTTFEEELIVV
ncbi:MAG TPA: Xaa-Pro peptidase family protein [Methanocorpusculum sp.]|jgi:Xaa-Pro aminopeptidase|nr:Xaa-Pro peptidase family protein [Methanocorpusculum sp.]HJJ77472.1 Xaa-Pro peptidase family protein [Methanocorpusculum sp.]